jgi:DeoR/GlpR family transcriptional regulator of sugar metabolism
LNQNLSLGVGQLCFISIEDDGFMHALERKRRILELLQSEPYLTVARAEAELGASPATIRRDFADLAEQSLVVRGHGGIHRLDDAPIMGVVPYSRREVQNPEGKERIARAAAALLAPGDVVIVDGGTTTAPLARHVSPLVRVITNSLRLATALNEPADAQAPVPEVNMPGGYLYPKSAVLLGPQTIAALRQYHANWAFISCSGITTEGLLNSNHLVADTQRAMIERAEKVAVLVDQTKLRRTGMVVIADLATVDVLITDVQPPADLAEALTQAEVQVVVA